MGKAAMPTQWLADQQACHHSSQLGQVMATTGAVLRLPCQRRGQRLNWLMLEILHLHVLAAS